MPPLARTIGSCYAYLITRPLWSDCWCGGNQVFRYRGRKTICIKCGDRKRTARAGDRGSTSGAQLYSSLPRTKTRMACCLQDFKHRENFQASRDIALWRLVGRHIMLLPRLLFPSCLLPCAVNGEIFFFFRHVSSVNCGSIDDALSLTPVHSARSLIFPCTFTK